MRVAILALLTAALLAATVSQAAAALPAFKTNLVVVGKSIGGAKLGASKASVQKAWGKSCTTSGPKSCSYNAKGDTQGIKGTGTVSYTANGKLFGVSITAPSKNPFRAPFTKLRTAKGSASDRPARSSPAPIRLAVPRTRGCTTCSAQADRLRPSSRSGPASASSPS